MCVCSPILPSGSSALALLYRLHGNGKISKMPAYDIKEIPTFDIDFSFSSPYFKLMGLIIVRIDCQVKLILHGKHHLALLNLNLNPLF